MIFYKSYIHFFSFLKALIDDSDSRTDDDNLKKKINQSSESENKIGKNGNEDNYSASSSDIQSEINNAVNSSEVSSKIKKDEKDEKSAKKSSEQIKNEIKELNNRIIAANTTLNDKLGLKDDIYPINDRKQWAKLLEYIKKNENDFIKDGRLEIDIYARSFYCVYTFVFLPTQIAFGFPGFIFKLIPEKSIKIKLIKNLLTDIKIFLEFIKFRSKKSFLIKITIQKQNSVMEDLAFLSTIYRKILSNPIEILTEMLKFRIVSDGYEEFKIKNKKI